MAEKKFRTASDKTACRPGTRVTLCKLVCWIMPCIYNVLVLIVYTLLATGAQEDDSLHSQKSATLPQLQAPGSGWYTSLDDRQEEAGVVLAEGIRKYVIVLGLCTLC